MENVQGGPWQGIPPGCMSGQRPQMPSNDGAASQTVGFNTNKKHETAAQVVHMTSATKFMEYQQKRQRLIHAKVRHDLRREEKDDRVLPKCILGGGRGCIALLDFSPIPHVPCKYCEMARHEVVDFAIVHATASEQQIEEARHYLKTYDFASRSSPYFDLHRIPLGMSRCENEVSNYTNVPLTAWDKDAWKCQAVQIPGTLCRRCQTAQDTNASPEPRWSMAKPI